MNGHALTVGLRERATEEGFDAMGVAVAQGLERDGAVLEEWLRRGRHADMHWMARDPSKRADPRRLVPGCKSVIGQRLKQSGMEWSVRGANAIIALRCTVLSGRLEDYWESRVG